MRYERIAFVAGAFLAFTNVALAQTVADLANGRLCAVSLDGKRSGVLAFDRAGNGLQVHVYRSTDGSQYTKMKANPDIAFIRSTAQAMEDEGIHPVTIEGNRLKFTNGRGANPDLALSPDGKLITGKASTKSYPVTFDGFCVK